MTESLIDKAIKQYNYVWPEFDWDDTYTKNKNAIVICLRNHQEDDRRWFKDELYVGGTDHDFRYFGLVCTKEQFESRVDDLQLKENDWYDYESQKLIKLPPVGVECEYLDNNGEWYSVKTAYLSEYVIVLENTLWAILLKLLLILGISQSSAH